MTRFNILMKDAVKMVEWTLHNGMGGEIVIPKIPSLKVVDLADAIAPSLPKKIIGIRQGEKDFKVEIKWTDGSIETFDIDELNKTYEFRQKL